MAKTTARRTARYARKGETKSSFRAASLKIGKLNPRLANASIGHGKVTKRHAGTIAAKKIKHSDGSVLTVFTVKLGSKTFDSDLHHAFTKSIARARKENKQKLGVRDYSADRV